MTKFDQEDFTVDDYEKTIAEITGEETPEQRQSSYTKYHKEYAKRQKQLRRWKKFNCEEMELIKKAMLYISDKPDYEFEKSEAERLIKEIDDSLPYVII